MINLNTFKSLIKTLFNIAGFKITKKQNQIINLKEFNVFNNKNIDWELIQNCKDISNKKNKDLTFLTDVRFYSLISVIKNILSYDKLGDFVELGCWNGTSARIIASLIKKNKKNINFYIFDIFKGLSELNNKKDKSNYVITNNFIGNYKFVKEKLKNFKFVKIFPGWIPEKFYKVKNKKFSFVHIDLCLYEPTLQSLKFFYPRLKKGGIIISNVYNSKVFPGERKAFHEFFKTNKYSFMYKHALTTNYLIK